MSLQALAGAWLSAAARSESTSSPLMCQVPCLESVYKKPSSVYARIDDDDDEEEEEENEDNNHNKRNHSGNITTDNNNNNDNNDHDNCNTQNTEQNG